ncbi:hypothetical protein T265_13774 [Opisthorchis viverrini]|uniref:Mannosyltransferase n=1 Tax=Opisthorchis viverrini TaxID=6198 RepID=A0A074ZJM3_OPIVI|nr:hypothetical protein T265_13774 [Opisthorchis viverrini]KER27548.1 hypothetical protein T265_13774 [Opisthorchis viverrini]
MLANYVFFSESRLFSALLVFRLLNALLIQTTFVPDEFWQSIEVAHKWSFGYGTLTWEWWPETALRSPLHPLIFSVLYNLGSVFGLDSRTFVVLVPRLFHAVLAAAADLHLYRFAVIVSGLETAKGSVRLIRLRSNLIAVTHIPVALYTCLIHQRGPIDTVSALRKAIQRRFPTNREILSENVSILALMPCHTLPPVSFIHLNVSFKQLNCDPDLSLWFDGQRRVHYDEADEFYDNPARWLNERFDGLKRTSSRKPTFITLFDHLFDAHPSLKNLLLHVWGYRECGRFFHAHFLTHRRYGRYIYILCHAF